MKQASLAVLEGFKTHFSKTPLQPVRCADLAGVIQIITKLFDQAEQEFVTLSECIDDLAGHTGYQLKKQTEETTNG